MAKKKAKKLKNPQNSSDPASWVWILKYAQIGVRCPTIDRLKYTYKLSEKLNSQGSANQEELDYLNAQLGYAIRGYQEDSKKSSN